MTVGSRCLWNTSTDTYIYTSASYKNTVQCTVYGVGKYIVRILMLLTWNNSSNEQGEITV